LGLGAIFIVIIIAVDFLISMWDAYAGGYSLGAIKAKGDKSKFRKAAAYSAVGLGLVGATYVMAIVLGFLAYYASYITLSSFQFLLSFDFIFLGILIIGFGFIITVQSIIIAVRKPGAWSIIIALYNSFAMAFDISMYISSFKESMGVIRSTGRRSQGNAYMIILIAVLIAAVMVHAAYKHGYRKASGSMQHRGAKAQGSGMMETVGRRGKS
jgi:hypothetical protein